MKRNTSSVFDRGKSGALAVHQIEWAQRVFAEPIQLSTQSLLSNFAADLSSPENEALLYTNLQNRDSEVGIYLIELYKNELSQAVQVIRQGLMKREREIGAIKTRLETMQQFNQSEPNQDLHYSAQSFDELQAQLITETREISYLRDREHLLAGLDEILHSYDTAAFGTRSTEQIMRLFGQIYRGQARLQSFLTNFRGSFQSRTPNLPPYTDAIGLEGYLLPLIPNKPPIVIDRKTATFLRHYLETINQLANVATEYLHRQETIPDNAWFPILSLVRAIVELFYFCNFEIPFFYTDLIVSIYEDRREILSFDLQTGNWTKVEEDRSTTRHIKRLCTESAIMLAENGALLQSNSADKLNRFLKKELDPSSSVPDLAASRIRPYFNFGLADFDFNPSSQKAKLQAAFPSVKSLLAILTKDQSYCNSISSSPLGGTVETLLGLAELNPVAFGMSADIASLNILERAKLLSRFWRTASRRRPLVMLGEEYAKKVTQSLEALGEPSPENPTFMSIVLRPTMASIALMRGEQIQDPFTNLMLADQVRLAEMLKFTWDIASDFLDRLKDVHSQGKLKRIIEGIAQQNQAEQSELSKRFNVKWLQSSVWVWSMLRAVAPALWDFWTKVGEGTIWQDPFLKTPPLQALSLLVKLFCDSTRLMLLVEASGSSLTERIEISAEAAGQSILSSIHDYLEGSSMPPVLAEAVNYYYDPSERFDYWAGFTSSFHKFLKQMLADLHSVNATKDYLEGLSSIISQLEILYPNRPTTEIVLAEPPPNASSISQPEVVGVITEEGAQSFASLFFEKLGLPETETSFFLRMLSLLARKETERFIYKAEEVFPLLDLILPLLQHRLLLFSFPTTTSAFFDYLLQLAQRDQVEEATIESLRTRTNDYFIQLDSFAETLFDLTSQLPNLLPTDKKALTNFLQATTPVNRDMPYLLLFAGDQLVLDMCLNKADRNYQVETALSKIRAYLREQIGGKFEEPSIEIFPIGGGRIVCREDKVLLTGQNESFEFAFTEPEKAMSNYLISRLASVKFSFVAQILKTEFPEIGLIVQP